MKVLVAGDQSVADVAGLLAKAFRTRGREVDVFYFNAAVSRMERAPFGGRELKKIGAYALNVVFGRSWKERYFRVLNAQFLRRAIEIRPDLIFVVNGVQLFPETLAELKRALGVPMANWVVDDPVRAQEPQFLGTYPLYDILFCCGPEWLDFAKLWDCRVEYMPLATDPEVYRPLDDAATERLPPDDVDIVFVGSFFPRDPSSMFRAFMVAALADHGYKVKVYGREIGGYKRLIPGLRMLSIVGGGNLPAAAVNRIYNQARIVLNIHNIFNQYVVALRVFEVSSAGGFQLTAYQRALDELFPHGMIETYRNQAELLDKVGYYLKNPEERGKKARAASVFAREHHTYLHRVDQILNTIFPHRA